MPMRRTALLVLLMLGCVYTNAASASTVAPRRALHEQLETLTHELYERTERAARNREALQHRIVSSQQLVSELYASERSATELLVRETRARMQALRDALHAEMHAAVVDVQQRVQRAVQNVSALAQQRMRAKRAHDQQLRVLAQQRRDALESQRQAEEALESDRQRRAAAAVTPSPASTIDSNQLKPMSADAIATASDDTANQSSTTTSSTNTTASVSPQQLDQQHASGDQPTATKQLVPLLQSITAALSVILAHTWRVVWRVIVPLVLVLGAVLLALVAVVRYERHQRKKQRAQQRVLYSRYLQPRNANAAASDGRDGHAQRLTRPQRRDAAAASAHSRNTKGAE